MNDPRPLGEAPEQPGLSYKNKVFSGTQARRAVRALAASADRNDLRAAYLDLLKLSLCDLCGTSTTSVWKDARGEIMSRELRDEELQVRAMGVDWPLHGLTMVGLHRLDDLQARVESIVEDGTEGDLIEAGTWRGGASILMRATLNSLGAHDRTVWVADSFEGFPLPDEHTETGHLAPVEFLSVPLEEVKASFARLGCEDGVRFVPGFFQETLSSLSDRRWSLIRLDGDSYDASWTTLASLYPGLSAGGYVVVDDYGALPECQRAVEDFRRLHGISEPLEQVDWTSVRWRRTSEAPIDREQAPAPGGEGRSAAPARVARSEGDLRIPTMDEIALQRHRAVLEQELAAMHARLGEAQAEVARLSRSPLRVAGSWLKERLRRVSR